MINNIENKSTFFSDQDCIDNSFILPPGRYLLTDNKFYIENIKYIIRERKSGITSRKTKYFISALKGKAHEYISSLYKESKDVYSFDYKNNNYTLIWSTTTVTIEGGQGGLFG